MDRARAVCAETRSEPRRAAFRILVAIDLSDASIDALRETRSLARSRGAELGIVHVVPPLIYVQALFPQNYAPDMAAIGEFEVAADRKVRQRISELTSDEETTVFVERGEAYAEVVRRAEAWSADLVVVGRHGRTALSRALLGSVAERIVRYAHCRVLVVRRSASERIVVVATDLSDPSLPAIATGVKEARLRGARLVVAHVVDSSIAAYLAAAGGMFGSPGILPPPELQREARAALVELLHQSILRFEGSGEPLVLDGAPVAKLVNAVEELRAELLVVATHGRTGLARVALGSVAEQLVRLANCSVMVVRQAGAK